MDKALFSTGNTEWETPQEFFDTINQIFNFDVDVCATAANAKCRRYFTKEQDGLEQTWLGTVWCNPPYGRDIEKWIDRASNSYYINDATIVMLLPSRTDTKWMHRLFDSAHIIFLKGRLKFGSSNNSAPFPSMLAIWGTGKTTEKNVIELAKRLDAHGFLKGGI